MPAAMSSIQLKLIIHWKNTKDQIIADYFKQMQQNFVSKFFLINSKLALLFHYFVTQKATSGFLINTLSKIPPEFRISLFCSCAVILEHEFTRRLTICHCWSGLTLKLLA